MQGSEISDEERWASLGGLFGTSLLRGIFSKDENKLGLQQGNTMKVSI